MNMRQHKRHKLRRFMPVPGMAACVSSMSGRIWQKSYDWMQVKKGW